jgi:RNA polymerase sigma factor (sigma-70 family)
MHTIVKYNEEELLELLKSRSREGFNYLYDNYSGAVYSVILTIISDRDHAADVLQEVFVKIWKQIDSYDSQKGKLYTWMVQIARNSAIDVVRSKKFQVNQQNQELPDSVYEAGANDFNPDKIGLRHQVSQMKPEHRELLELAYFQGYTQDEMSEMLNIPLGTVKTRMRSALIQLRKFYIE